MTLVVCTLLLEKGFLLIPNRHSHIVSHLFLQNYGNVQLIAQTFPMQVVLRILLEKVKLFLLIETVGFIYLGLLHYISFHLTGCMLRKPNFAVDDLTINHVFVETVETETGCSLHLHWTLHFLERRSLLPVLDDRLRMVGAIAVVRDLHSFLGEAE